jgi:hypothetical protein
VIDPVKSKAVVLYTRYGSGSFPYVDPAAVRRLPMPEAAQLARYAEDLVREMFEAFPPSWRADVEADPAELNPGLAQSVELVEAGMAARHPELDATAARALAALWIQSAWRG